MKIINTLIAVSILSVASLTAQASDVPDAIKTDIKTHCSERMAKYGDAIIYACAVQDIQGYISAMELKQTYPDIVTKCESRMSKYGWNIVNACATQDIESRSKFDAL